MCPSSVKPRDIILFLVCPGIIHGVTSINQQLLEYIKEVERNSINPPVLAVPPALPSPPAYDYSDYTSSPYSSSIDSEHRKYEYHKHSAFYCRIDWIEFNVP